MNLSAANRCAFALRALEPECFVGRDFERSEFLKRATGLRPPLLNLVGPSKIGRTSFLLFLQQLSRKNHKRSQYKALFERVPALVMPYIDLGAPRSKTSIRKTIVAAIASEMRKHKLKTLAEEQFDESAALEQLAPLMKARGARYVLLVDRCEQLLADRPGVDEDDWTGGAILDLGTLNEYVPELGIALSFGASGPVSELDAQERLDREQKFLETVSSVLKLVIDRMELGPLERSAVEEFARGAWLGKRDGRCLSEDEVQWIIDVSGGHPYVLQTAGVRLSEMHDDGGLSDDGALAALERTLVTSLSVFVGSALRRLSKRKGARTLAMHLAESKDGDSAPRDLAEILVGEGLAVIVAEAGFSTVRCTIPSRAIRAALLDRVAKLQPQPEPVLPPSSVSVEAPDGSIYVVPLTESELKLMERLLHGTAPDELVPRVELASALQISTQNLTQRLSVLSKKIRETCDREPFENRYGKGYRLINRDAFRLRP